MRSKSTITLFAMIGLGLILFAGGCRHRRMERATAKEPGQAETSIAPSDATADGKELTLSIVDKGGEDVDFVEREEIRRAYKLVPGARVEIANINGRVDVETADTDTSEVLIIRSAKKREDLQFRQVAIEHNENRLHIYVQNDRKSIWSAMGFIPEGRQRVILKLPRKVEFETRGINGNLTVGEIDGSVDIGGSNGQVTIAQASGGMDFRGINGNIEATISKLSGDGIEISGVNGNSSLRFIGDVNADIEARGINGRVEPQLPNVEVRKGERYGSYEARIGNGGAKIEVHGVNGNIYLSKAEKAGGDSPKTAVKAK